MVFVNLLKNLNMKCIVECVKECNSQCILLECKNIHFEENEINVLIKKYQKQQCFVRNNQEYEELEKIINVLVKKKLA